MNFNLSPRDLDIMARTIAGEAGGEGPLGMQAVGEVILNRLGAGGFGDTAAGVALAPNQFSAWNAGEGGNSIPRSINPGGGGYEQAMAAALAALGGDDPTMGATHYYAPQGMPGGAAPDWWGEVAALGSTEIGNHRFAGGSQARGILASALSGKNVELEAGPTAAATDVYTNASNQAALEAQAPVGHWTQGLANALNMGYSGYMDRLALEQGAGAETAANDAAAQQQAEAARIAAEQEAYNRGQDAQGNARADAALAMDMQPEPGWRIATADEIQRYGMPGQVNEATGEFKALPKGGSGMTVYGPDGNPIVTTGDVDLSRLTEPQQKMVLFGSMMEATGPALNALEEQFDPANIPDAVAASTPIVGNFFKSNEYQQYETSGRAWAEGVLRLQTGAAATQPEIERVFQTYFAAPGDSPQTIALKKQLREAYAVSIGLASGGRTDAGAGGGDLDLGIASPVVIDGYTIEAQ